MPRQRQPNLPGNPSNAPGYNRSNPPIPGDLRAETMSEDRFSNSRRDFVHGLIGLIPAVTVGASFVSSPTHAAAAVAASAAETYGPKFFSAAEMAFINAACDRLIPSDENGPGALELD